MDINKGLKVSYIYMSVLIILLKYTCSYFMSWLPYLLVFSCITDLSFQLNIYLRNKLGFNAVAAILYYLAVVVYFNI